MRRLPSACLTLPSPDDRTLPSLARKARLLGIRALLSTPGVALANRVRRELEADGPGTLERVGAPDVLPRLLCLAAGIAHDDAVRDLEQLYDRPAESLPVAEGVHLALRDTFPLAHLEGHPDKDGNAWDLGGQDTARWVEALGAAFQVIESALPEWNSGVRPHACARVVPTGWDDAQHRSASFREAPGLAYLSLHPNPLTMAEAVVHEGQHSALNLLSHFDALLDDGPDVLVTSPVRPDPRPLRGVLFAVHAFVPVAALHLRLAEADHPLAHASGFVQRRQQVLHSNHDGLTTLEGAHPTAWGTRILRELRALHDAVAAAADPIR